MDTWVTDYEMNGEKCARVWRRKWYASTGDGYLSRDGEILEAEGAEAQRLYDAEMHEYEMSAM